MNTQRQSDIQQTRHDSLQPPESFEISLPEKSKISHNLLISKSKLELCSNSIFSFQENDNITPYFTNDYSQNFTQASVSMPMKQNEEYEIIYQNPEEFISFKSNNEQALNCIADSSSSVSPLYDSKTLDASFNTSSSPIKKRYSYNQPFINSLNQLNTNNITSSFNRDTSYSSNQTSCFNSLHIMQEDRYFIANLPLIILDRIGCINAQKKLFERRFDYDWITLFFKQIEDNLVEIILNQYGNYVIQKMIEIIIAQGNKVILLKFFQIIENDLYSISIHKFGTIVIQTVLELLMKANIYAIALQIDELNMIFQHFIINYMLDLCSHKYGNHVFQKFLYIFPHDKNELIFRKANEVAFNISKLQQGASIIHSLILNASIEQRNILISSVLSHLSQLINDENANYTIQCIVEISDKKHKEIIYSYIKENMSYLVKQKCASNVIDKCLKINDNELSKNLIRFIIKKKMIKELICNCYGNYIIQNALKISKGSDFNEIINQIKQSIKKLKQSSLGKQVLESLSLKYPDIFSK